MDTALELAVEEDTTTPFKLVFAGRCSEKNTKLPTLRIWNLRSPDKSEIESARKKIFLRCHIRV